MLSTQTSKKSEPSDASKGQNVQVIIRVRPLTTSYHATNGGNQIVSFNDGQKRCIREVKNEKVIVLDTKDSEQYTFDFVANENIS